MSETSVAPFLMFEGRAEEAMNLYGAGGPGPEGSLILARFSLSGQTVLCSDSFVHHAFTFTPSASLFVTCASEEEFDGITDALSTGSYLMPKGNYGFSRKFAWFNDRFGVSWQVNLE